MLATIASTNLAAQHPAGGALRAEMLAAFERVLDHGQFILGPEVQQLEITLQNYLGAKQVVGVSSGTAALVLALRLKGIGPGDEVLTVSHSFVATAIAIRLVGAEPVFVDISEDTMLMDVNSLKPMLSNRTRAVLPVHLNGQVCERSPLVSFCAAHGLCLIEDCAQALGARHAGVAVGGAGLAGFSLHPMKILNAAGDAGFIACESLEEAERLKVLRNLGLSSRDNCSVLGDNCRLDTLQAALVLAKLPYLAAWQAARREHAEAYKKALTGKLRFARVGDDSEPVVSCLAVRHPERERILEQCRRRGLALKVHYPIPIHKQPPFRECRRGSLPVTELVVSQLFTLPATPELPVAERVRVIQTLAEVV